MRQPKPGSKTERREIRQTAKQKTTPTAGARHVPLQSSEPHHPDTKNNGSREKGGRSVTRFGKGMFSGMTETDVDSIFFGGKGKSKGKIIFHFL